MNVIKTWYYFCAYIKYIFFKFIYGSKLKIGKHVTWRKDFSIMIASTGKIVIGDKCFFNNFCSINANKEITIGDGSIFGENVKIYDHNHRFSDLKRDIKVQGYSDGEVHIGRHCWIGSNVTILKGCEIGNNCVIGAGCIVSGKIEDNTIVRRLDSYKIETIRNREE